MYSTFCKAKFEYSLLFTGLDVVDGGGQQQLQQGAEEDTDDVSISRNLASMRSMSESDHVTSDVRGGDGSQDPEGNSSSVGKKFFKGSTL